MNNIDKLKEKIEKDYKDMMAVINSTSLPLFVEDTIEDMHILIKTLIAENKELKEENNELEVINKIQEYRISVIDERELIPKSKVKEVIEEVKEDENPSISSFQEYAQEYAIDKLQSLLGKE